jgi:hypothetical protein
MNRRKFVLVGSIMLILVSATATTLAVEPEPVFHAVECEGSYPNHLQGVCTNERDAIYWCFTTKLVKTDRNGKVLKQIDAANHHGDLCFHAGKVFVAVNLGKFNDADGHADSWVYVYDAGDLTLLAKHPTPDVIFGAGGIAYHDGRFVVVGGLPERFKGNNAYEYDAQFKLVKLHRLKSLATLKGIQTAAFADGHWWFGCYGEPNILLQEDELFADVGKRFEFDCSLGIVPLGGGKFLVARGTHSNEKGHTGRIELAEADDERGLKMADGPSTKPGA